MAPIEFFSVWQKAQLLDSKTMPHALRVNFWKLRLHYKE